MLSKLARMPYLSLVVLLALFYGVSTVFAGSVVIVTGEFTTSSPTWIRPAGPGDANGEYWHQSTCTDGYVDYPSYYETYHFTVTADGDYVIQMLSYEESSQDANFTLYKSGQEFGSLPCVAFVDDINSNDYRPRLAVTLEAGETYLLVVSPYGGTDVDDLGEFVISLSGVGDILFGGGVHDGRINTDDAAAPVVVYPSADGIAVYSPSGVQILFVSLSQIDLVGDCPSSNTLIASNASVAIYRLASCEFQINAPMLNGKVYVLIFTSLDATSYTSYELE